MIFSQPFLSMISSPDPVFREELGRNADKSRRVCGNAGYGKISYAKMP